MIKRKLTAALLSLTLIFSGTFPMVAAAQTSDSSPATRGQIADTILAAADDYSSGLTKGDVIKGYGEGGAKEDQPITRAEAFVMISRAFGPLPAPTGDSLRSGLFPPAFSDVPTWARSDIENLRTAGVIAGVGGGMLGSGEHVTAAQVGSVIQRIYALKGSNLKDDFYSTVNKSALDQIAIPAGEADVNSFNEVQTLNNQRISAILNEMSSGSHLKGSKEQKISDLYKNVLDVESRNRQGIAPIKHYLDSIDQAKTARDVFAAQVKILQETGCGGLIDFALTPDAKNSSQQILAAGTITPMLTKEMYTASGPQQDAYIDYLTTLLKLSGEAEDQAQKHAKAYYELEKSLSAHRLDPQEYGNVDKIYNLYTIEQLQRLFPSADIASILAESHFQKPSKVLVIDKGILEAAAPFYTDSSLELLKTTAKLHLIFQVGTTLQQDFEHAGNVLAKELYGIEGTKKPEEIASAAVQQFMGSYLGQIFVSRYFSEEAKQDVEHMVQDFISIYKERIGQLAWMSSDTKKVAMKKLDTMKVRIGYPDDWSDLMDQAEIKSIADGGSYCDNVFSYMRAYRVWSGAQQSKPADKNSWILSAFTVNAMYNPSQNSITFPAGILQAPFYDINAKHEANLGGIGSIIAHEITHAFDNNGAKYDENGNAVNWWTEEDYTAFQALCEDAVKFYDGIEAVPGINTNGMLTLSENVADLGGMACALEAASRMSNPDYDALFRANARVWRQTATRDYLRYLSQLDVHSANKVRVNRVVVNFEPFYTTYDVKPGDGMYLPPEDRVSIW